MQQKLWTRNSFITDAGTIIVNPVTYQYKIVARLVTEIIEKAMQK